MKIIPEQSKRFDPIDVNATWEDADKALVSAYLWSLGDMSGSDFCLLRIHGYIDFDGTKGGWHVTPTAMKRARDVLSEKIEAKNAILKWEEDFPRVRRVDTKKKTEGSE